MSTQVEKALIRIQAQAACNQMLSDEGAKRMLVMIESEAHQALESINKNIVTLYESFPANEDSEEKQNDA